MVVVALFFPLVEGLTPQGLVLFFNGPWSTWQEFDKKKKAFGAAPKDGNGSVHLNSSNILKHPETLQC